MHNSDNGKELGYQYLNTQFTGTFGTSISGSDINEDVKQFLLPIDLGVAASQSQFESKSFF